MAKLPALAEAQRQERTAQFLDVVRNSSTYSGKAVTLNTLALASTIFRCTQCDQRLTCPAALLHPCQYIDTKGFLLEVVDELPTSPIVYSVKMASSGRRSDRIRVRSDMERTIFRDVYQRFAVHIWAGLHWIVFDDVGHEHMLKLLKAAEKPRRMLVKEMEKMRPRIYIECVCECFREDSGSRRRARKAMRWIRAVNDNDPWTSTNTFTLATDTRLQSTLSRSIWQRHLFYQAQENTSSTCQQGGGKA